MLWVCNRSRQPSLPRSIDGMPSVLPPSSSTSPHATRAHACSSQRPQSSSSSTQSSSSSTYLEGAAAGARKALTPAADRATHAATTGIETRPMTSCARVCCDTGMVNYDGDGRVRTAPSEVRDRFRSSDPSTMTVQSGHHAGSRPSSPRGRGQRFWPPMWQKVAAHAAVLACVGWEARLSRRRSSSDESCWIVGRAHDDERRTQGVDRSRTHAGGLHPSRTPKPKLDPQITLYGRKAPASGSCECVATGRQAPRHPDLVVAPPNARSTCRDPPPHRVLEEEKRGRANPSWNRASTWAALLSNCYCCSRQRRRWGRVQRMCVNLNNGTTWPHTPDGSRAWIDRSSEC